MEKGDLSSEAVTILMRIARNLPVVGSIDYGKVDTELGPVYIALGKGYGHEFPGRSWHGVYAINGIARTGEVRGHLTMLEAQRQFLDDACWLAREIDKRDLWGAKFHA
jgi:hypothetical protein